MSSDSVIYVAALTFQRPDTLSNLLDKFLKLELPGHAEVRFLIVDNDPEESARSVVEAFIPRFKHQSLLYVVEPEPGIPAGRNRALQEAIEGGGDLLCFTDDDAWPNRAWLRELVACYRESGAVLVFGPHRFELQTEPDGIWNWILSKSIVARAAYLERYAANEFAENRVCGGGTGNWLGDLDWIARSEIRFEEERRQSGGEDAAFREAVRSHGGRLAWCPRAIMYEQLPPERISLRYQFRRSRSHGITYEQLGCRANRVLLRYPVGRILTGVGLIFVPVIGFASLMLGVHLVGMGMGILQARRGARSRLYER